jgi:PKD domain
VRKNKIIIALSLCVLLSIALEAAAAPTWKPSQVVGIPDNPALDNYYGPGVELDRTGRSTSVWFECNHEMEITPGFGICDGWNLKGTSRPARAGAPWSVPETISSTAYAAGTPPELVVDASGRAHTVWFERAPLPESVKYSTKPVGGSWSAPMTLSDPAISSFSPQIAVDDKGDVIVGWLETPSQVLRYRTKPQGQPWSARKSLGVIGQEIQMFDLATNPAGAVVAAFVGSSETADMYRLFSRTRATFGGSWTGLAPVTPETAANSFTSIQIAIDRSRNLLASWRRQAGSLEAAERPLGSPWGPTIDVDGTASGVTGWMMSVSPSGRAAFVWMLSQTDLEGRKRPSVGGWRMPANLPLEPGSQTSTPTVDVGAGGRVVAAWLHVDSGGSNYSPRAAFSSATTSGWGSGSDITPTTQSFAQGSLAVDPKGNALLGVLRNVSSDASPYPRFMVIPLDGAGPVMARLKVPKTGRDDTAIRFSVAPFDIWTALAGKTKWTFGDGKSALGNSASHRFANPGNYTVKVTRADANGTRTTVARRIHINP